MIASRFEELYELFSDGALSDADRREFLGLLEDPANRARLAQVSSYEAAVSEELRLFRTPVTRDGLSEVKKASSRSWPKVGSRWIPIQRPEPIDESRLLVRIGFAAAAAALIILALVFVTSSKSDAPPVVVRPKLEAPPARETPPLEPPRAPVDAAPAPKAPPPQDPLTPRTFTPAPPPLEPPATPSKPAPVRTPKPTEKATTKVEEAPRESATFVATFERVFGGVTVGTEPGEAGKGIPSGRTVATARGGYACVKYPDGSRIELAGETTLAKVVDGPAGKSAQLEQGMIFVDAARQPAGRPFVLSTAQAESQVVGTQFVLQAMPASTRIDVREGRVKFTRLPQGISSVMVNAGHYAVAGPAGEPAAKPGIAAWKAPPGALQFWLRADANVKPNGTTLSAWGDLSTSGNSAVQDKPGAQPTLVANAAGGRPALRFDGADDFLLLPDGFSDFRAGLTAFVVVRPAPGRAWARFIDLDVGPACDNIVFGFKDAPDKLGFWVYSNSQTRGKVEAPGAVAADQVQSFCALMTPSGRVTLYKNGAAVGAGDTSAPRSTQRKPNTIGKSNSGGGDPLFKGDIFEILLYARALSDVERVYVETYLTAKYLDPTTPPAVLRPAEK